MDWIKKNPAQFALALFALGLIGVAAMLFLNTESFAERFSAAQAAPNKSRKLPELDTGVIDEAKRQLNTPKQWASAVHKGLLFTSEKYTLRNSRLEKWEGGKTWAHSVTGELVENEWFPKYGLPETDSGVLGQDPDGDGFLNEDEWLGKTDPTKKESHPPYHTKLWLKRWVRVPFRLKFQAYDGDPRRDSPDKMTFQINALDLRQPSEFLRIGDTVSNTKFKIMKYEFKEKENPSTGEKDDVSELTLLNTETSDQVVLVLNQVVNSPSQFGEFEYRWNKKIGEPGLTFNVPKLKEFALQPQPERRYKLLDVNEREAVIETPQGEKITVTPYPKR
jgi:hypothetical protein